MLTTLTVSSVPSIGAMDLPQAAHFGEYILVIVAHLCSENISYD